MKAGDMVKWVCVSNDDQEEIDADFGVIIELRIPPYTDDHCDLALVMFDTECIWLPARDLEVVSESR